MTSKIDNFEKLFASFPNEKNATHADAFLKKEDQAKPKRRLQWFRTSLLIFLFTLAIFITARIFKGQFKAAWHQEPALSPPKALPAGSVAAAGESELIIQNTLHASLIPEPAVPDLSALDTINGVSIAVSVDPDGNQQLYDLDSRGTIRMRKSPGFTETWTEPEVVPANPVPNAKSPLAAIAWRGNNRGYTNLRLYYLDSSNRIVELASSCSTSAPCTWTRLTYFTAISTGGLSAVYMNDDGIRVYCIGSSGSLWVLVSSRGPWYAAALGMTARPASGLSATVIPSDSGPINGIYLLHVGPDGDLKEITWDRAKNYTSYFIGRPVDPDFHTRPSLPESDPFFSIVYGIPAPVSRAYYLSTATPLERWSFNANDTWSAPWNKMVNTDAPDVPGGSVAAIGLNGTDVKVYYTALGSLMWVGHTVGGAGNGWRKGSAIH